MSQYCTWHRYAVNHLLVLALFIGACQRDDSTQRGVAADEALTAGLAAYEAGDFPRAHELLSQACTLGGLQSEAYTDAQLKMTACLANLAKFDEAHRIFDEHLKGAPNQDEVHAAKAYVLLKQGNRPAAEAELGKARKINPRIGTINKP